MSIPDALWDAPWIGKCKEDYEEDCRRYYDYMDGESDYLIDEAERRRDDRISCEEDD